MTSGQYSYLMLRKMQTYISCSDSASRAYLYNFYGSIFNDPSVIVDEESYHDFMDFMDFEIDYCARQNYRSPSALQGDENFSEHYTFLQNAFRAIDVDLHLTYSGSYPSSLIFTLPSGEQKILSGLSSTWYSYLSFNARLRTTDSYLVQMRPYYLLEHEEPLDLSLIGTNAAGYNTRWMYDAETKTLEITGDGSLADFALWEQLGIEEVDTIIIGAGVNRFQASSLGKENLIVVDLHGEMDEIILEDNCGAYRWLLTMTWAKLIIYSDNQYLRQHETKFAHYPTIEWHPLSEWKG